jgi:hypothetical protein
MVRNCVVDGLWEFFFNRVTILLDDPNSTSPNPVFLCRVCVEFASRVKN